MSDNNNNETSRMEKMDKNLEEIHSEIIVVCPHCNIPILIEKLNCFIFRHGIFIKNGQQIPPHSNKNECDYYIQNNLIYGCGKPFRIIKENQQYLAIICEYI